MRIGFLFNHAAGHQVSHALPIALALKDLNRQASVELLVSQGDAEAEMRRTLASHDGPVPDIKVLRGPSRVLGALHRSLGRAVPLDTLSTLQRNLDLFQNLDALVVPEKSSLMLKSVFGIERLKLIHTRHGAGDRAIGFDKASGKFDMVLLSGPKIRDRLAQAGHLRNCRYAMVGYPKFDLHAQGAKVKLFPEDRPTILYQPHPSPALSSWYRMGREVLAWFAASKDYNLIFAPHVMLFRKSLTVSLSPFGIGRAGKIPEGILKAPHIHVDTGSPALLDMTYTRAADVYLGDAGSQVYEFLTRPRPCIFLNPARHRWKAKADFAHWQAGPVVETIDALDAALKRSQAKPEEFADRQKALFEDSFDLNGIPSSQRAARAIANFMGLR